MNHEDLVEKAKQAIDLVFGDQSVSQQQTLESLDELKDHIDVSRDALLTDLKG